jgi:ABC-type transporter Mla subunit MlaD
MSPEHEIWNSAARRSRSVSGRSQTLERMARPIRHLARLERELADMTTRITQLEPMVDALDDVAARARDLLAGAPHAIDKLRESLAALEALRSRHADNDRAIGAWVTRYEAGRASGAGS